jgi:DNA primase
MHQVDMNRMDGRARLVELARPLLSKMPQGVLRQMMLDRLAELSRMDVGKLPVPSGNTEPASSFRPAMRGSSSGPQEPPSIVRRAIALMLQHPALAQQLSNESELADLDLPGMPLLLELYGMLKNSPTMNTAAIIESFSDSEYQHHLSRLAVWDYPALAENVEMEFGVVINRLCDALSKQRTERLLQKQHAQGLNQTEKDELARLLSVKRDNSRLSPSRH